MSNSSQPMNRSTPGLPVHHQLPESTQTHVVESMMQSNHLILCCPLLLLPSTFPASGSFPKRQVFTSGSQSIGVFSFNISPSKEHPRLTSFRMDWLDLLAVQGTLKSLLQHHSSKASILQRSAFFIVQLSYPYMTTGNIIALTRVVILWYFLCIKLLHIMTPRGTLECNPGIPVFPWEYY